MEKNHNWSFFTNHGHVLFLISKDESVPVRDVASTVGITERATRRIIADLVAENYIKISKEGRKNRYRVNKKKKLRHKVEEARSIQDLLDFMFQD